MLEFDECDEGAENLFWRKYDRSKKKREFDQSLHKLRGHFMVDYANVISVGGSLLIIIAFGFILFKFKFLPFEAIKTLNTHLLKCCFLPMIARNLGRKNIHELDFNPFVIGILTTITTHVFMCICFLFPFKNKFKNYLSSTLPCVFVNYLVIGYPIFDSIWGTEEDIMVQMMALSNDLCVVPIYLVLTSIYFAKNSPDDKESQPDGKEESLVEDIKPKSKCRSILEVAKKIVLGLVTSPIILGNVIGFIWSATGWKFPTFLSSLLKYMGEEVLSISLICVGGFLAQNSIIACNWIKFILCILVRHLIMPAITMFYCWVMNTNNRLARQCIIMTILPTGTTAFMLSSQNNLGPGISSTMVFWSTVLNIPFTLLWFVILDNLNLFPE